jgi:hypothetical protein
MVENNMVKYQLTNSKIQIGAKLLNALISKGVSITAAFWYYETETGKWRLVFASPDMLLKGPKYFYKIIQTSIFKEDDRPISLMDIQVVDDSDPIVSSLLSDLRNVRKVPDSRLERLIEDFYIYEPSI